jgi:hypothetical protein
MFNLRKTSYLTNLDYYLIDSSKNLVRRKVKTPYSSLEFAVDCGDPIVRVLIDKGEVQSVDILNLDSTRNQEKKLSPFLDINPSIPVLSLECQNKKPEQLVTLHDGIVIARNATTTIALNGVEVCWGVCFRVFGDENFGMMFDEEGWFVGVRFNIVDAPCPQE